MDSQQLESFCNRIINGFAVVKYDGEIFFVHDPRPKDKVLSSLYYEERLYYYYESGCLSAWEADLILDKRMVWGVPQEKDLTILSERFNKSKNSSIQDKINFLIKTKNCLVTKTAEYLATLDQHRYHIFLLSFNNKGERVWENEKLFFGTKDKLIDSLLNSAYFDDRFTEKNIRLLARSEPWRSMWMTANKTSNLFSHPTTQMTDLQRMLVIWSMMYDSVYESMEKPEDHIINDDDLLDEWFNEQKNKSSAKKENKVNKSYKGGEIGLVASSPEEARMIWNKNDPNTQRLLSQRSKQIWDSGNVAEGQLRDVKMDLQLRKNQIEKERVKKNVR